MIDLTTKLGAQAAQRLQQDDIIWLTTVSRDGTPQPNPVWFYWNGKSILIYTQPASHKLKNISRNPRVSVNFQANDEGDDVIVLTGDASIDKTPQPHDSRYIEKYRAQIPKIGLTPESLAASYSTLIRVSPTSLRGF
jgi:PPOX class probable F420-dependent enzyme